MRTRIVSLSITAVVILVPMTAAAQGISERAQKAAGELVAPANMTLGAIAGVPTDASNTGSLTPSVEFVLDASAKDKTGTVAIGWRDGQGQFRLSFSAPLDANGEAEPISLLGLPSGATAKLAFNRLNWRAPKPSEQLAAIEVCTNALRALNRAGGHPEAPIDLADCDVRKNKLPPLEAAVFRQLSHLDDRIWLIGLDASIARSTFNYLTRDTLDAASETNDTLSGTARLGYFTGPYGFLFASYSYRHAYRPGSSTLLCRPIAGTDGLRCDQAVLGKPRPTTQSIATVELRKFFASRAAINPSVQYDFRNHVSAVDVPIYYIKSADGTPTGGVRFGWRSDTKAVTASLFIGGALSLLP